MKGSPDRVVRPEPGEHPDRAPRIDPRGDDSHDDSGSPQPALVLDCRETCDGDRDGENGRSEGEHEDPGRMIPHDFLLCHSFGICRAAFRLEGAASST